MTTPDPRRNLGMAWRRRVTIFWSAWLTPRFKIRAGLYPPGRLQPRVTNVAKG